MLTRNAFLHYLLGFSALLIGLMFYLSSPAAQSSYVQSLFSFHLPRLLDFPKMLGPLKGAFPEFIHPLAFSLIGIGLVAHTRRGRILVCMVFGGLNLIFESAQYLGGTALGLHPGSFQGIPILENSWNYFQNGTFSYFDLVAILLGSVSAFAISEFIQTRRKKNEHQTAS